MLLLLGINMLFMDNNSHNVLANHHISVDCVILGFDGKQLHVLLVKRVGIEDGQEYHDMKLPGSLIYKDEDLDGAARRVLNDLTGLKNVNLTQFKAFGSKDRTNDPKDVHWLERGTNEKIDSIVTIAYLSLVKLNRTIERTLDKSQSVWVPLKDVPSLAFDHNIIIREALIYIRKYLESSPALVFELLPRKFTAAQLRTLFEVISEKSMDIRNFHKKMSLMEYVIPLDEFETGVSHRAARYYRFDKKIYNKLKY